MSDELVALELGLADIRELLRVIGQRPASEEWSGRVWHALTEAVEEAQSAEEAEKAVAIPKELLDRVASHRNAIADDADRISAALQRAERARDEALAEVERLAALNQERQP